MFEPGIGSDGDPELDEMTKLRNKLVSVSNQLLKEKKQCGAGDLENGYENSGEPPPYVLPVVPYEKPLMKDGEKVMQIMKRIHSMTTSEMRKELKLVHLDSRGTRSQIYERLKKHFRREYAILKNAEPQRNKTEKFFEYLVVMDFECTCEETIFDYEHEIIEFPAVLIDVRKREIVDSFRSIVRPTINPILSDFCIKLTGITQKMIDEALLFVDVFDSFRLWMQSHRLGQEGARYAFVTDGPWDIAKFFQMQCVQSGINPIPHDFRYYINIRKSFANRYCKGRSLQGMNLDGMLKELKMTFEGREHSGIDDSRNIARIVIRMLEDRAELRINEKLARPKNKEKARAPPAGQSKEDRDRQAWRDALPLKVQQVNRDSFISGEYLDCDSCEEES